MKQRGVHPRFIIFDLHQTDMVIGIDRHRTAYLESSKNRFGRSFLEVFPFSENKGAVRDRSGGYYINLDGKPCFKEKYLRAYPFKDGLAAVCDDLGMFHIDSEGKPLYSRRFAWVSEFHEGFCVVRYRNGKWTFIDHNFTPWETDYRYCTDFSNGYAAVLDDSGFYHIDSSGTPLYEERYDLCRRFDHGLAPVMKGGHWHLIDRNGKRFTEDLERIDEGRNGLFAAVKGEDFGYIAVDGTFRKLFELTEPAKEQPLPQWIDDLKKYEWDSCVIFARHSERITHFISNSDLITYSDITSGGEDFARRIGKELSEFKKYKIHARCSSSQRCVTTTNCILGAMGVQVDVETCPEIGPRGTAFFSDNGAWHRTTRSSSVLCIDHLINDDLESWYPNEVIRDNLLNFVKKFLDESDSMTFCINHDIYVIPAIAYILGRFPRDQWVDYCEGLLFLRKGDRIYAVCSGKEFPLDSHGPIVIDTSKSPSDIVMDLPEPENNRSWEWQSADDISWVGRDTGFATTACDRNGRFFFGRYDGFLVTSRMFSFAGDFNEQIASVYITGKGATHVTDFGDILHNTWFKECMGFGEGLSPVRDASGWHYADVEGNIVSKETYDLCDPVFHGESLVMIRSELYIRTRDGGLIKL